MTVWTLNRVVFARFAGSTGHDATTLGLMTMGRIEYGCQAGGQKTINEIIDPPSKLSL
jgi:hypothetical protein